MLSPLSPRELALAPARGQQLPPAACGVPALAARGGRSASRAPLLGGAAAALRPMSSAAVLKLDLPANRLPLGVYKTGAPSAPAKTWLSGTGASMPLLSKMTTQQRELYMKTIGWAACDA